MCLLTTKMSHQIVLAFEYKSTLRNGAGIELSVGCLLEDDLGRIHTEKFVQVGKTSTRWSCTSSRSIRFRSLSAMSNKGAQPYTSWQWTIFVWWR